MKWIFALLISCISLFIIGCSKPDNGNSTLPPIKEIITQCGDSIGYAFYTYNNKNELISVYDSNNNGHVSKTLINYNDFGLPVSSEVFYKSIWPEPYERDSFIYNNNNQVTKKIIEENLNINDTLIYDNMGRLVSEESNGSTNISSYADGAQFIYDNNNDVIQSYTTYTVNVNNTTATFNDTIQVTYNNTLNPYRSLFSGSLAYIIFSSAEGYGFELFLSKHNLIREVWNGVVSTYQYEYNPDGTLARSTITYPGSSYYNSCTSTFFY